MAVAAIVVETMLHPRHHRCSRIIAAHADTNAARRLAGVNVFRVRHAAIVAGVSEAACTKWFITVVSST